MPRAGRSTYRDCRRGQGCYQGAPRLSLMAFAARGGAARSDRCRVAGVARYGHPARTGISKWGWGGFVAHREGGLRRAARAGLDGWRPTGVGGRGGSGLVGPRCHWGGCEVIESSTTAGPGRASGEVAARGVSGYSRVGRVATGVCRTVHWRALGDPRRPRPGRLCQYLGDAHLQRDHHNVSCGRITATRRTAHQHLDRPRPRRHSPVPGPTGRARSPGRQGDSGQRRSARDGTIPGDRGFRFPPRGLPASGGGPNGGHRNQQLPSRHADH